MSVNYFTRFLDANTRTFSMLLMNELLMANGFPPAILEDPNRSTAYALDEVIQEVIKGMQRTMELIKTGTLQDELTTQQLQNFLTEEEKDYFKQVIDLVESQRKEQNITSPFSKP